MQKHYANLHTAKTSVYLFDSICNQDILQINRFHAALMAAIANAKQSVTKTLTLYIDCPDTVIDERFQPTLTEIYNAVKSGIKLNIQNSGEPNSIYVRVFESITEVAKIPTTTNSPFSKHTKQH